MINLWQLLRSGYVTRWHSNPDMAHIRETNAEHQGRVVHILLAFHPDPPVVLIRECALHDSGEMDAGDLSGTFKRKHPDFAKLHAGFELEARLLMGTAPWGLTDTELAWVDACDKFAALAHVAQVNPRLLLRPDWVAMAERTLVKFMELDADAHLRAVELVAYFHKRAEDEYQWARGSY